MNQQFNQGQQFADADLARELAEVSRGRPTAPNSTLYTIDPRGLVAGADLDEQLDPVDTATTCARQDSLRVLADETGGIAVVNQNDFYESVEADRRRDQRLRAGLLPRIPIRWKRTREGGGQGHRPNLNAISRTSYTLRQQQADRRRSNRLGDTLPQPGHGLRLQPQKRFPFLVGQTTEITWSRGSLIGTPHLS